jgi:sugar fermentation stimulation protein A
VRGQHTPGVYHLVLRLRRELTLCVGKLGHLALPAGWYVYTGSAMGGLEPRLRRHQRQRKKLHWHIDYLLQHAELVEIVPVPTTRSTECERNRWVLAQPGVRVMAPGFGSSDCRCPAHLAYFPARTALPWKRETPSSE